jgi:hypothetical protein
MSMMVIRTDVFGVSQLLHKARIFFHAWDVEGLHLSSHSVDQVIVRYCSRRDLTFDFRVVYVSK